MSHAIPRDDVHRLAEACADAGADFQQVASRLLKQQRRISKFIESNAGQLLDRNGEIAMYLSAVVLRIFDGYGGRMRTVTIDGLQAAQRRVMDALPQVEPFDAGFPDRARAVAWRAQPHILDEALWGLYDRQDAREDASPALDQLALLYLLIWVVTEAANDAWTWDR